MREIENEENRHFTLLEFQFGKFEMKNQFMENKT